MVSFPGVTSPKHKRSEIRIEFDALKLAQKFSRCTHVAGNTGKYKFAILSIKEMRFSATIGSVEKMGAFRIRLYQIMSSCLVGIYRMVVFEFAVPEPFGYSCKSLPDRPNFDTVTSLAPCRISRFNSQPASPTADITLTAWGCRCDPRGLSGVRM